MAKSPREFGYESVVVDKPLLAINSACHHLPDLIPLDVTMPEAVAIRKRFSTFLKMTQDLLSPLARAPTKASARMNLPPTSLFRIVPAKMVPQKIHG